MYIAYASYNTSIIMKSRSHKSSHTRSLFQHLSHYKHCSVINPAWSAHPAMASRDTAAVETPSLVDFSVLYLTAPKRHVPCVTCDAEMEKRDYPDLTNTKNVPRCTRLSLCFSDTCSKIIRATLRVEEGQPGDEARDS